MALDQTHLSDERLVFIDGFMSTSDELAEWIEKFETECQEESGPSVEGFSYNKFSDYYSAENTDISIRRKAKDFESFLASREVVVPVAYSLGATFAVRGARRALDGNADVEVRRLFLIGPAFWPHRALERLYRAADITSQAIAELNDPKERVRRILYRDLRGLLEDGIEVVVLYSALDTWCPWQRERLPPDITASPLLREVALEEQIPKHREMTQLDYHKVLKAHPYTLAQVCFGLDL